MWQVAEVRELGIGGKGRVWSRERSGAAESQLWPEGQMPFLRMPVIFLCLRKKKERNDCVIENLCDFLWKKFADPSFRTLEVDLK